MVTTVINKNGSSTNTNTNTASSAVGGGICDGSVINSRKYITTSNVTANDKENVLKKDNNSNKTSKTSKTNNNDNGNDNGNDKGISCNIHELLLSSGNKKKNNSTTTTTTINTTTKMPMPMPMSRPIIQESNIILSRSYDTIKKEISKNVLRHKLQKLRHLVLPGVISTKYLDNEIFYPMHQQQLFQPQTVTYNGGIANVKKWKISSYLEVMEGGVPCTNPNLKLLEIFRPLLETCDDLFLVWYKQQHACNSNSNNKQQQQNQNRRRTCQRLMTFVTRYTPVPGEQALLKHIDGAGKVDGSCVIALPVDKWSAPYDVNSFEGHGGGLTFWDGKEPVPVPVTHNDKEKEKEKKNDDNQKEGKEAIQDTDTTKTTMTSINSNNNNQNNDNNAVEVEEAKTNKTITTTTATTTAKKNNKAPQKFRPREIHYETRSGDIAFIDRAVWHQADPITKGTRWALVIFYKVMYEDDDNDNDE